MAATQISAWTVIDEQTEHVVESGDPLAIDSALLGWERKPEGLCREDVCVALPTGTPAGAVDAQLVARLLQRPLVIDADERVAAFAATFTDTVIDGCDALTARTSLRVHVKVASPQFQPAPVIDVAVSPAGSVSDTLMVPLVASVPLLETEIL